MNDLVGQPKPVVNDCQNNTAVEQQMGRLFQSYMSAGSFKGLLLTLSIDGTLLQISTSQSILGYSTAEVVGKPLAAFLLPEDAETFLTFLLNQNSGEQATALDLKARSKDGNISRLRLHLIRTAGCFLAICEEANTSPKSSNGTKATEQVLQALLDNSFDLLALIDRDGNYLYVSESFYDNFEYAQKTNLGYKAVDIVGTNCFTYMHPDDLPRISQEFATLFGPEKKVYSPPFRFKNSLGDWRWVEAVVTNQLSNPDINAIVVSCRDVTQQVKTEQRLKEMQLWEALVDGEEKERSRIAKDLHDGVAGMLAAAKMHLASLQATDKEIATSAGFRQAIQLLEEAATEVRKTSHNLMPELLLQHGLEEALRRFCCSLSNNTLNVQYDSWGKMKRYKSSFELSVYRVVQELLNNVVRHSQASEVLVQFYAQEQILYITVEDNGIGIPEEQLHQEGMGLCNLQSRVKTINGTMEIVTGIGEGVGAYLEFNTNGWEKKSEVQE
jgi:PAS domain S-box-containing protein